MAGKIINYSCARRFLGVMIPVVFLMGFWEDYESIWMEMMSYMQEVFFAAFFVIVQLLLLFFIIIGYSRRGSRNEHFGRIDIPIHYFQRLLYYLFLMLPAVLLFPFLGFFHLRSGQQRMVYIFVVLAIAVIYLLTYYVFSIQGTLQARSKKSGHYDH